MTGITSVDSNKPARVLYLAFELSYHLSLERSCSAFSICLLSISNRCTGLPDAAGCVFALAGSSHSIL